MIKKFILGLFIVLNFTSCVVHSDHKPIGMHYLLDLWHGDFPTTRERAENLIREATHAAQGTVLLIGHAIFNPGLTAFGMLKESHISIHTWPEHDYASVDVYTCGATDARKAVEYIIALLRPQKMHIRSVERGAQESHFGQELIIDLYECNDSIIHKGRILHFSKELCDLLQVKAYGPPFLERFAIHDPDIAGYSLAQMIETSLISAHFSEKNKSAYINIFSCKPFDALQAVHFVKRFFQAKKINYQVIMR